MKFEFRVGRLRDGTQIPDQPGPRHHLQQVVGDVHFPPEEALAHAAHVHVVVVVPALAERDQGENEAVLAVIACFVAA